MPDSPQILPLYLNGTFRRTGGGLAVRNPANSDLIGHVSTATPELVRQALSDAHHALPSWRQTTAAARADFLLHIAAELETRSLAVARLITLENGKPISQSRTEVAMSIDHLRWFAAEARRAYGRIIPEQIAGKRHLVIKSPIGVVGAISPWNFPLMLAVRKIAPALAAGCTVILKPAAQTPLSISAFAECVHAAKLPAAVFQWVLGPPQMIGEEFLNNPVCRKITFTGSTRVGKQLISGAAAQVKRLSLELGGQAPLLVFDDADLKRAVDGAIVAKFRNTGQSCIAANRFYVQDGIYDRFVAAFTDRVRSLCIGNGLEDGVEIGPLISEQGLIHGIDQIKDAVDRGARVLTGGKRWGTKGFFLEPTVLVDVTEASLCLHEETFAPIAPIVRFANEEQAIELANTTPYGLAAYAFTTNLDRAWRLMEKLEAGNIGLNDGAPSTSNAPFGGLKQSGWGRELGQEGLDAFLETKHISLGLAEDG